MTSRLLVLTRRGDARRTVAARLGRRSAATARNKGTRRSRRAVARRLAGRRQARRQDSASACGSGSTRSTRRSTQTARCGRRRSRAPRSARSPASLVARARRHATASPSVERPLANDDAALAFARARIGADRLLAEREADGESQVGTARRTDPHLEHRPRSLREPDDEVESALGIELGLVPKLEPIDVHRRPAAEVAGSTACCARARTTARSRCESRSG